MSLKIGQVAKLLDMPAETIRFYEKNQILAPRRKENSTYREYEPWDIFDLFDCIGQRNLGFSVREVKNMMKVAALDEIVKIMKRRLSEMDRESLLLHQKMQELEKMIRLAEVADYNVGKYWFEYCPEKVCKICSYSSNGHYTDFDYNDPVITEWIKQAPFVKAGIIIDPGRLMERQEEFEWVLFVKAEHLSFAGLAQDRTMKTIPAGICLNTIVDLGAKGEANAEAFRDIVSYAADNKFLCETAVGELFLRNYEADGWHRYVKISIPVKKIS